MHIIVSHIWGPDPGTWIPGTEVVVLGKIWILVKSLGMSGKRRLSTL